MTRVLPEATSTRGDTPRLQARAWQSTAKRLPVAAAQSLDLLDLDVFDRLLARGSATS